MVRGEWEKRSRKVVGQEMTRRQGVTEIVVSMLIIESLYVGVCRRDLEADKMSLESFIMQVLCNR